MLLANVSQVKGPKKQQSLREHAETARRARQLVTSARRPAAGARLGGAQTQSPDVESLKLLCTECGFHRFRDELGAQQRRIALNEV